MISKNLIHGKPMTMAVNIMSSKENDEERVMHSKSNKIEIMISDETDKVIEELF